MLVVSLAQYEFRASASYIEEQERFRSESRVCGDTLKYESGLLLTRKDFCL
jgi:hypothetical protein